MEDSNDVEDTKTVGTFLDDDEECEDGEEEPLWFHSLSSFDEGCSSIDAPPAGGSHQNPDDQLKFNRVTREVAPKFEDSSIIGGGAMRDATENFDQAESHILQSDKIPSPETQPTATSKLVGPELKLRQIPGHEEKAEEVYFQTPQQATTDGKSQLIVIDLALNTPAPYTVQRPLSKAVVTLPQCSAVQPRTIQCTPSQKVDIVHTKEATSGGQSSSPVQPIQHPFSIKQPIQEATKHIKGERVLLKNKMLTKDEYFGKEAVPVFACPSRFSSDDDSMSYLISSREEFQPVQYGGGVFGLGGADLTELPDEWMNKTPPPIPVFPSWCYQLDHPPGCETTPHPTPWPFVSIAERFPPPVLEVKPFSILSWNPSIPVNERAALIPGVIWGKKKE